MWKPSLYPVQLGLSPAEHLISDGDGQGFETAYSGAATYGALHGDDFVENALAFEICMSDSNKVSQ